MKKAELTMFRRMLARLKVLNPTPWANKSGDTLIADAHKMLKAVRP